MMHSLGRTPPKLSQSAHDALCRQVLEAAESMSDDQILSVADALHDTLRARRRIRAQAQQRLEDRRSPDRMAADGMAAFPA